MPKKVFVKTCRCQMNKCDSGQITDRLDAAQTGVTGMDGRMAIMAQP
jgi:hypothetical protein